MNFGQTALCRFECDVAFYLKAYFRGMPNKLNNTLKVVYDIGTIQYLKGYSK